jgi:hypothetical protein
MRPAQIIGYDPINTRPNGVDLVHHMDLFLCDETLGDRFSTPADCSSFSVFM